MEEGRYDLYNHWSSMRKEEEFQEEDVWGIIKERRGTITNEIVSSNPTHYIASRKLPNAARLIPRATSKNNSQEPRMVQQSAPVSIPDWSKIYGKKRSVGGSKTSPWHVDDGHGVIDGSWDSDEDDDDGSHMMMPPHEYIARRHARGQTPSFSVCEGAGRTLKGRDLSRVRNAVLTRTGFLE